MRRLAADLFTAEETLLLLGEPGLTEPLVLDVERLAFGFDALAHHEGQVVFLPYAAPGDRVTASVVAHHRGYLQAEIDTVLRRVRRASFPAARSSHLRRLPVAARRASRPAGGEGGDRRRAARTPRGVHDVEVLPTIASPTTGATAGG